MALGKTLINVTQLAELVGMNRNMVARRLRETEMDGGNGENLKQYELGKALRVLIMPSVQENGEMSPQDRKAWYQSENERLKYESAARELIPADECADVYRTMCKGLVIVLETLPDLLERDCALTPTATKYVQDKIDDFRDHLYSEMRRDAFGKEDTEEHGYDEI
jgi:DNA-binding Lrp family transcriptional regulator